MTRAVETPRRWPLVGDGLAVLAMALGTLFAVVLFLPAEGRIAAPLHDAIGLLLGRAAFVLPLGLLLGGVLKLVHSFLPEVRLPSARLVGVVLIATAALPAEHLVGLAPGDSLRRAFAHEGGGLLGHWLGGLLLDWLGGPATAVVLGTLLVLGSLLAFDLTLAELAHAARRAVQWARRRLLGTASHVAAAGGGFKVSPWVFAAPRWRSMPLPSVPQLSGPAVELTRVDVEWQRSGMPHRVEDPAEDRAEAPADASPDVNATDSVSPEPPEDPPQWLAPAIDLFHQRPAAEPGTTDLAARSRLIEETLASFNIEARVVEANPGPTVTQFGIEPAPGVAVSRILSRQNDLALRLGVSPIRLETTVPGKSMLGLEVPNSAVATVTIRDVLESTEWQAAAGKLRLALGRDVAGTAIVGDLGRMPHLLIAGATGAGKSVCINTIVGSLLYQFSPAELQLVMIDPKRVELVGFGDVPHLRLPVITDMDRVVGALRWLVLEMDRRYKLFAQHAVRHLDGYNRWAASANHPDEPPLPFLVVVIDELADMMMTAPDEVEKALCRLAQLARATGIHLVVATQRPSVDVLTGLIKANFPTRIAFAVSSQTDSRVILDQAGAEKLLGRGDALFMPPDAMKPVRLQGAFVSDEEMTQLVGHWKAQGRPRYTPEDIEQIEALGRGDDEDDEVYERAVELAETVGRLSATLLQRRLGLGRERAQKLLDRLVEEGVAEG